ncbi:hypothetical protein [Nocardia gipuzkoensis]
MKFFQKYRVAILVFALISAVSTVLKGYGLLALPGGIALGLVFGVIVCGAWEIFVEK